MNSTQDTDVIKYKNTGAIHSDPELDRYLVEIQNSKKKSKS